MDFKNRKVWAPDVAEGFILGRIVDIGSDTVVVEPIGSGSSRKVWGGGASGLNMFESIGLVLV